MSRLCSYRSASNFYRIATASVREAARRSAERRRRETVASTTKDPASVCSSSPTNNPLAESVAAVVAGELMLDWMQFINAGGVTSFSSCIHVTLLLLVSLLIGTIFTPHLTVRGVLFAPVLRWCDWVRLLAPHSVIVLPGPARLAIAAPGHVDGTWSCRWHREILVICSMQTIISVIFFSAVATCILLLFKKQLRDASRPETSPGSTRP